MGFGPLMTRVASGKEAVAEAARLLRDGQVVAIPTETVYGLAASALDAQAVARVFDAKGRPQDNPLIVHVADEASLFLATAEVPEKARTLMRTFWPGPLSLVLPKGEAISDAVSAGLGTLAVRMPSHPVAIAILREAGIPIAAPSANLSGRPSPTSAAHVLSDLDGRIPLVVDGGQCEVGVESTVVDMTRDIPLILRPGAITREDLEQVVGSVDAHSGHVEAGEAAPSPGMKYAHYRPRATVRLFSGPPETVAKRIRTLYDQTEDGGGSPLILCARNTAPLYGARKIGVLGCSRSEAQRAMFAALRSADAAGADLVLIHYEPSMGEAVRNRLWRASADSEQL